MQGLHLMIKFKGLNDNFHFLVLEIKNQISHTYAFLNSPDPELQDKIISKDDHIDNLKNIVENDCFARIVSESGTTQQELNTIRAMQTIAVNLERIADFCVNIVRQVHYLSSYNFLHNFDYAEMIADISYAIELLIPALKEKDLSKALDLCRTENNLDQMYQTQFEQIMEELKDERNAPGNLITILFISRYFERIGDSLLNIGEAIIFSIIGEKIKINQFQALQKTLSNSGFNASVSDFDFSMIWGTRSGCRIGRVENKADLKEKFQNSIFKEGQLKKIAREKENLDTWESIFPALVPKVFGFEQDPAQDKASLLLELIPGCTLEETILATDRETLENAVFVFQETLMEIWKTTQKKEAVQTDFTRQLMDRQESVLQIHPFFKDQSKHINSCPIPSFQELVQGAARKEAEALPAPFQVFIHGDLNVNNIVYSHTEQKIHFIDLHRSRYYDYVQDISVFLISNFRLPVFDPEIRARIKRTMLSLLNCSRGFAAQENDWSFEFRLALAVARSLFTSTRFELNNEFSREMFLRSRYLLQKVLSVATQDILDFRFPEEVLFYKT